MREMLKLEHVFKFENFKKLLKFDYFKLSENCQNSLKVEDKLTNPASPYLVVNICATKLIRKISEKYFNLLFENFKNIKVKKIYISLIIAINHKRKKRFRKLL